MPPLGHLQLTSVLRGVLGQGLPDETAGASEPAGPGHRPEPRDVRARALAAGTPPAVATALAAAVAQLGDRERAQVVEPLVPAAGGDVLRLGTAAALQTDGTTCGSAVLALLAAAGDPSLAYWLVTGRTVDGYRPPELVGVGDDAGTAARFGALQAALLLRTGARAVLGVLPWPSAAGTPPWGAARVARFPGVAYRSVLVDDTRQQDVRTVLARVLRAVDRGVPVPLYTGGDVSTGLATAVPRHVVLVTARDAAGVRVYDPSSARVRTVATGDLLAPDGGPRAAFGGWSHVCWAVLPVRR